MIKDYYKILEIDRDCTLSEIKKAYRAKALFWHPDKNSCDNAHEMFIEISEAYNILSDTRKRSVYDKLFENLNSRVNEKQKESSVTDDDFKSYKNWTVESSTKAANELELSFDKFKENLSKIANDVNTGCGMVFLVLLWISWGPMGIIGTINVILKVYPNIINNGGFQEYLLAAIIFPLMFLFTVFITIRGGKFLLKTYKI